MMMMNNNASISTYPLSYLSQNNLHKEYQDLSQSQLAKAKEFNELIRREYDNIANKSSKKNKIYYTHINHTTRFLISQEFKSQRALDSWKKWYEWRINHDLDNFNEENIVDELYSGKLFVHGHDKYNRTCIIYQPQRIIHKDFKVENNIKLGTYMLDKAIDLALKKGQNKIVILWDKQDNLPTNTYEDDDGENANNSNFLLKILFEDGSHDFYINKLYMIYILHPKLYYKSILKTIIQPFIIKKTKTKLKIINQKIDLLKYFHAESLLIEHGGLSNYAYRYQQAQEYKLNFRKTHPGVNLLIPFYLDGESFVSITIEKDNDPHSYYLTTDYQEQESFDTRYSDTDEKACHIDKNNNDNIKANVNNDEDDSQDIPYEYNNDNNAIRISHVYKPYTLYKYNFKQF